MDNSIYKKCTECGQTKHISEFSKSYPNRCKTCVAEHTRQMRAAEKLKAKVKATGEVIDVEPSGTMQVLCGSFITKDGRRMPGTALEFEKAIDWEQRRYEIAKEIMKGFSANHFSWCRFQATPTEPNVPHRLDEPYTEDPSLRTEKSTK